MNLQADALLPRASLLGLVRIFPGCVSPAAATDWTVRTRPARLRNGGPVFHLRKLESAILLERRGYSADPGREIRDGREIGNESLKLVPRIPVAVAR
jgi:hypothetical protein